MATNQVMDAKPPESHWIHFSAFALDVQKAIADAKKQFYDMPASDLVIIDRIITTKVSKAAWRGEWGVRINYHEATLEEKRNRPW